MAKSLRSKQGRKNRNIKRIRYGKKELIRLKKMLGLPTGEDTPAPDFAMKEDTEPENLISRKDRRRILGLVREGSDREDSDAEKEIEEVTVLATTRKLRKSYHKKEQKEAEQKEALEKIEKKSTVTEKDDTLSVEPATVEMENNQKRVYSSKTLQDQFGNYPIWMNQKKLRTLAKSNRKIKKIQKRLAKRPGYRSDKKERNDKETSEPDDVPKERNDKATSEPDDVLVVDNEVQDVSMESVEEVEAKQRS